MTSRQRAARAPRTVCVLICSYRRSAPLLSCLAALAGQTRPPDDVIVVARRDDPATHAALRARPADALPWRIVPTEAPGLVAARNAGLVACRADIAAFCDDDTRPHPDWVARVAAHFARDPALGGLGGRDRCHDGARFDERRRATVGRIRWYGRTIGNHHLGHGAAREVQFLKGANMSFRREAIAGLEFDTRLRGRDVQPHDNSGFSMRVRRAGWKLRYDPAVLVDHFPSAGAARSYVSGQPLAEPDAYSSQCYNFAMTLWDELSPAGRVAFAVWSPLVGTRGQPGLLQAVRLTARERATIWRKFLLCQHAIATVYLAMLARRFSRGAPPPGARATN